MNFRRETARKLNLVTVGEARKLVQEFFQRDTPILSTKTIYNKVWAKELRRYGPKNKLLLDKDEVLQKLCRHYGT